MSSSLFDKVFSPGDWNIFAEVTNNRPFFLIATVFDFVSPPKPERFYVMRNCNWKVPLSFRRSCQNNYLYDSFSEHNFLCLLVYGRVCLCWVSLCLNDFLCAFL